MLTSVYPDAIAILTANEEMEKKKNKKEKVNNEKLSKLNAKRDEAYKIGQKRLPQIQFISKKIQPKKKTKKPAPEDTSCVDTDSEIESVKSPKDSPEMQSDSEKYFSTDISEEELLEDQRSQVTGIKKRKKKCPLPKNKKRRIMSSEEKEIEVIDITPPSASPTPLPRKNVFDFNIPPEEESDADEDWNQLFS